MRFIFGVVVGIALTIAAAAYHDNNAPRNSQNVADQQLVNWEAFAQITHDMTGIFSRWWDQLLGRSNPQR